MLNYKFSGRGEMWQLIGYIIEKLFKVRCSIQSQIKIETKLHLKSNATIFFCVCEKLCELHMHKNRKSGLQNVVELR